MNIRKNDNVIILNGKDRGKQGKVLKVMPKDDRVLIEKINIAKKHVKPTKTTPHGGIIESERPMIAARVMLMCPHCSKPTRIGHKLSAQNKYVRICKHCKEIVD